MAGKVINSRFAGECIVCHQRFPASTQIEYTKGEGARHLHCRGQAAQAKAVAERVCKFKFGGQDARGRDVYHIRVMDPTNATNLSGEAVVVSKASGGTAEITLGKVVRVISATEAIYEKAVSTLPGPDVVPAGRYCVPVTNPQPGGNDFVFLSIWRKGEDRVQAYMILGPQESLRVNTKLAIERIVEVGVAKAAEEYGRRVRHCCICNSRLTNRLSRELNIGPVCGERVRESEDWSRMKAKARAQIRAQGFDPKDSVDDEYEFPWHTIRKPTNPDALLASQEPAGGPPKAKPKGSPKLSKREAQEAAGQLELLDPQLLDTIKRVWAKTNDDDPLRAILTESLGQYVSALQKSGEIN